MGTFTHCTVGNPHVNGRFRQQAQPLVVGKKIHKPTVPQPRSPNPSGPVPGRHSLFGSCPHRTVPSLTSDGGMPVGVYGQRIHDRRRKSRFHAKYVFIACCSPGNPLTVPPHPKGSVRTLHRRTRLSLYAVFGPNFFFRRKARQIEGFSFRLKRKKEEQGEHQPSDQSPLGMRRYGRVWPRGGAKRMQKREPNCHLFKGGSFFWDQTYASA